MRPLGYLLITVGFLAGAFVATQNEPTVDWPRYGVALAVAVAGVILVRIALRQASHKEERLVGDLRILDASLGRLVERSEELDRIKGSIDVYELRHRIDQQFREDLDRFADARESIANRFGLQPYADVMSYFAAGERYLNRVWSASTDGYIDEAHTYIEKAREQLGEALVKLQELSVRKA